MKTTALRRITGLTGLLLLALLVVAVGVQAALATTVAGSGGGSGGVLSAAQIKDGTAVLVTHATVAAPASSSSGTSTTTWILIGLGVALAVVVAAWAVTGYRRRSRKPSSAYCAQHPEDTLCGAA